MIGLSERAYVLSHCVPPALKTGLLLGCLLSASVLAEPPRPDDFAFGFDVETGGEGALWRLSLPEAIYRDATRADLGDLRVFDHAGNAVPHTLRRPLRQWTPRPPHP